MTTVPKIKQKFEALRSLAFGGVGASYAAVGAALANPSNLLVLNNSLDVGVLVSFDGSTDHTFLAVNETLQISFGGAKEGTGKSSLPKRTVISIKQAVGAASSGTFYASVGYLS